MNLDFLSDEDIKKYLIVDLSQIALATAMHTFERGHKFTAKNVRQLILSTIKHNVMKFKSEGYNDVIIAVDNSKSGYWRRQEQDYYKRNRAISREEKKDDFDWEGYFSALNELIPEFKQYLPYVIMDIKFCEADDVIAVLTKFLSSKGHHVRIISSDGDFTQLHKYQNVDQYSPMQKKFVEVKTGSPEEDCLFKIIKGDKKDCVASVRVRGDFYISKNDDERTPATSPKLITEMVNKSEDEIKEIMKSEIVKRASKKDGDEICKKYLSLLGSEFDGSIDEMIDEIMRIQMERFIMNRILIDFDYIREDIKQSILDEYEIYKPAPKSKLYSYFVKNGLSNLTAELNKF